MSKKNRFQKIVANLERINVDILPEPEPEAEAPPDWISNSPLKQDESSNTQERWLITHASREQQRDPYSEIWKGSIESFLEEYPMLYITYAVRL